MSENPQNPIPANAERPDALTNLPGWGLDGQTGSPTESNQEFLERRSLGARKADALSSADQDEADATPQLATDEAGWQHNADPETWANHQSEELNDFNENA